jgi:hypothetical protein
VFLAGSGQYALIAAAVRFGLNLDTDSSRSQRLRCHVRSTRLFATPSNKRIGVGDTPDGTFAPTLVDGPKPNRPASDGDQKPYEVETHPGRRTR